MNGKEQRNSKQKKQKSGVSLAQKNQLLLRYGRYEEGWINKRNNQSNYDTAIVKKKETSTKKKNYKSKPKLEQQSPGKVATLYLRSYQTEVKRNTMKNEERSKLSISTSKNKGEQRKEVTSYEDFQEEIKEENKEQRRDKATSEIEIKQLKFQQFKKETEQENLQKQQSIRIQKIQENEKENKKDDNTQNLENLNTIKVVLCHKNQGQLQQSNLEKQQNKEVAQQAHSQSNEYSPSQKTNQNERMREEANVEEEYKSSGNLQKSSRENWQNTIKSQISEKEENGDLSGTWRNLNEKKQTKKSNIFSHLETEKMKSQNSSRIVRDKLKLQQNIYPSQDEKEFTFKHNSQQSIWSQFTLNTYYGQEFLMNAKKTSVFPTTTFTITRKQGNFKETSDDCLGTVQANWFGDVLNVFGPGLRPSEARKKNQQPREMLATIVYETKILPNGIPRKFKVYALKPYVRYNRDFPEVRQSGKEIPLHTLFNAKDGNKKNNPNPNPKPNPNPNKKNIAMYKNREPTLIKGCKAYMLNLGPKAKEPAVQNFILDELPVCTSKDINLEEGNREETMDNLPSFTEDSKDQSPEKIYQKQGEAIIQFDRSPKDFDIRELNKLSLQGKKKNSCESREAMLFSKQSEGKFYLKCFPPLTQYLAFAIGLSNFTNRLIGQ